jgi:hypothetical protein
MGPNKPKTYTAVVSFWPVWSNTLLDAARPYTDPHVLRIIAVFFERGPGPALAIAAECRSLVRAAPEVCKVITYGIFKHSEVNGWQKVPIDEYLEAAGRHALCVLVGDTLDEESHLPHYAHFLTNLLICAWHQANIE